MINNISKVAIASYVGAILIYEGYAEKIGGPDIKFNFYARGLNPPSLDGISF